MDRAGNDAVITILVVDDDASVLRVGVRILEKAGYKVLTAPDGAEALGILERHADQIGLVLTDVVMPKMGGTQLLEMIRQRWDRLPVVLSSGSLIPPDPARLRTIGALGFVSKPYRADALLRTVQSILGPPAHQREG